MMHILAIIGSLYPQTFRSRPGPDVFAEMPAELLVLADPTGIVSRQVKRLTSFKLVFRGWEPSDGMHTH
jgi:hypothetical protein